VTVFRKRGGEELRRDPTRLRGWQNLEELQMGKDNSTFHTGWGNHPEKLAGEIRREKREKRGRHGGARKGRERPRHI